MKIHRTIAIVVLSMGLIGFNRLAVAQPSLVTERVLWDKRPISVELSAGQEKIIHFPEAVRYWLPNHLDNSVRALSANGVVYLTPLKTFEKTRIRVQVISTQKVYLLDLISTNDKSTPQELIVVDEDYVKSKAAEPAPKEQGDWFVRLTRFASQQLFAEERLMPVDREIVPVTLLNNEPIPLVRGGDIVSTPIKSWRGGGLTVTAVAIQNTVERPVLITLDKPDSAQRSLVLDTDLRGHWLAVTPQHGSLGNASSEQSTTVLYLLSRRNFKESL